MRKEMFQVVVTVNCKEVHISQGGGYGFSLVALLPHQVPILIEWLKEACQEIEADERLAKQPFTPV